MYQQTLSDWYGVHAGLEFTEARIQVLIQDLQKVTPARVREHRKWLRQNMHKWWQDRWAEPTPIAPQGIVHQSSTPEETTGPTEESEEGGGQPDPSRYTVGMSLNQTGNTQEAPHVTGAHDTQWSDLTTEETVALVELVNSIQNDTTDTSHTRNTGQRKAAKPMAERMEQKPGEEATDVPLQTGIAREGEGGDIAPQGQREQQANNEDSALNDIPEWLLEENIRLNRAITPPAEQFIRDQGERNDGDCGPAAVIGALFYLGSRADTRLRQGLMDRLSYTVVRMYAAHHLQYQSLLSVAQMGTGNTLIESEVKAAIKDMCEQESSWPKGGNPNDPNLCWIWEIIARTETQCQGRQVIWWPDILVALVTRAMLKDIPIDRKIQQDAGAGVAALQRGAARGFLPATALLNADRGILLVEDEVLALPEVQEQCAQFQVITVVSRGNHYVNYYRRERHCLAVMADPRDPPDTQWMKDWMTDLQVIRPLRNTNRRMKPLETQEAAPPCPLMVTYSNPHHVRFAVFSYSPDQKKYQDAKTAWHRIFNPANHDTQEEGRERGEGSASQPNRLKRSRATEGDPERGSRNGTKARKRDGQKLLESEDTTMVNHWSDTKGKRKAGKDRGSKDRQAQLSGRQRRNNRRKSAQPKDSPIQPKSGQEAATSTIHREDSPSGNNEKVTESATAAVVHTQRGLKRKQVRTDKGKVIKSRMLGVQTAQIEEVLCSEGTVQRPGVSTRAMCRRQAERDNRLGNQDTASDSGPKGIG